MVKKLLIGIAGAAAICSLFVIGFYLTDDGTREEKAGGGGVVDSANIEVNTETIYIEE
ncbi:MAG: hypothetical protein K2O99_08820 [Lachnospiraceae bacterium]|nr:hypothetical protein [Lachnospiraceae bacterium]